MKKLLYISAFLIALVSFTGCYSGRAVYVERPPVRRVMVAPPYYAPAPVIIEHRGRGWHRHRGW